MRILSTAVQIITVQILIFSSNEVNLNHHKICKKPLRTKQNVKQEYLNKGKSAG